MEPETMKSRATAFFQIALLIAPSSVSTTIYQSKLDKLNGEYLLANGDVEE